MAALGIGTGTATFAGATNDIDLDQSSMRSFTYIVDDDEDVRLSLKALIGTRADIEVQTFATGDEFMSAVDLRPPGVILLDLHMPGQSGIDVLTALAARQRRFATVMVTGQGDIALAVQAMRLGAIDFLEKPYDHELLFAAIDRGFDHIRQEKAFEERGEAARNSIAGLTAREREIFDMLVDGLSNRSMAERLNLSVRTVEVHRANLLAKLELPSLSAVIRLAYLAGLRTVDSLPV